MEQNNVLAEGLRDIQKVQLEILVEFDRICRTHEIRYQLFAGTLLGAIRHKGFIPWDDDIDVCMLRSEYNRFIRACKTDLDARYFLQTYKTDPMYYNLFARVRKNGTLFVQKRYQEFDFHHGIFIDIFPLDGLLSNRIIRQVHMRSLQRVRRLNRRLNKLRVRSNVTNTPNPFRRAAKGGVHILLKAVPKIMLDRLQTAMYRLFNPVKPAYVSHFTDGTTENRWYTYRMKRSVVHDSIPWEFEGHIFPVPRQYDDVLRQIYGDYLQFPPEEDRVPHHGIIQVEL